MKAFFFFFYPHYIETISPKKCQKWGFWKKCETGAWLIKGGFKPSAHHAFIKCVYILLIFTFKSLNFFRVVTSGSQCILLFTWREGGHQSHFSSLLSHLQGTTVSNCSSVPFLLSSKVTTTVHCNSCDILLKTTLYNICKCH